MSLILLNLQSNQHIKLNSNTPLVIGRGNIEGCFDKRVSRNHGKITCTHDGKVRLAALHCNPCFYTRNGVPPVLQLNKDEEETLNEGDYLGLLPNAFWFKVTSNKETEIKNQPGCSVKKTDVIKNETDKTIVLKNCDTSSSNQEKIIINKCESECAFSDKFKNDNSNSLPLPLLNRESNSVSTSNGFGTPEFEKTRRLPLWMYEIDDPVGSDKSAKKHSLEDVGEAKGKKQKILLKTAIKKEFETQSANDAKVEDEIRNLDVPSTSNIENDETLNPAFKSKPQEETRKDEFEKEGYESDVDKKNLSSKRPVCKYEGNCYRENPQHKLNFCHPGDPDYLPYVDRPLCQYGATCYRQNKKHKIEFRHPPPDTCSQILSSSSSPCSRASSPLPAKRRRKNVVTQNSDCEDDDYDLEDPFINDASSDEYIPSSLESTEEEDNFDASREDDY